MTLQGARRDTRTFEAFSFVTRETLATERLGTASEPLRRRPEETFRPTVASERRTTRLLPTGLW
jgi:hypothetical protein